jgi:LmbE family N-acetylglucosaminyl deacetylase
MDEPTPVPETPPTEEVDRGGPVLAVFAHPDDLEISAGGTVARWCAEGRAVHLLVLTNGDKGSQDPEEDLAALARTRVGETEAAGRLLGLASTEILATPDGELANSKATQADVALRIRRTRPAILLTCDPTAWFFGNMYFNHSDHRTAGAVALDAAFPGAGNPHFFPEQLVDGLEPWNVPHIWLGWTNEPNHRQDVTGFIDAKMDALDLHASQVQGDQVDFFRGWIPMEAAEHGRQIGVTHAEAFRVLDLG